MGQPITVTVRPGGRDDVRFFETNRSLTGMAIETYTAEAAPTGDRPPDVLARRLLDLGARKVTIYSNVVTVEAGADSWPTLAPKAVHTLEPRFEFYGDEAGWSFEARGMEAPVSKVQ